MNQESSRNRQTDFKLCVSYKRKKFWKNTAAEIVGVPPPRYDFDTFLFKHTYFFKDLINYLERVRVLKSKKSERVDEACKVHLIEKNTFFTWKKKINNCRMLAHNFDI